MAASRRGRGCGGTEHQLVALLRSLVGQEPAAGGVAHASLRSPAGITCGAHLPDARRVDQTLIVKQRSASVPAA